MTDDDVPYESITPGLILEATKKLLRISKGEEDPDERDSLEYRRVYPIYSLLRERIDLDADNVLRSTAFRVAKQKTLNPVKVNHFDKYVTGLIQSPLSLPLEEINPMHIVEQSRRITQLGPGGLAAESITEEANNIHPSEFGFLSPLEGPECMPGYMQVYTLRGWLNWSDVRPTDIFATMTDDNQKVRFSRAMNWTAPEKLINEYYEGVMYCYSDENIAFEYTPNHRVLLSNRKFELCKDVYGKAITIQGCGGREYFNLSAANWSEKTVAMNVYCAVVPNGTLLVRTPTKGYKGFWTGNSEKIGVDTRMAMGTRFGSDGSIYQKFRSKRTNQYEWLSPKDVKRKTIGLPD